MDRWKRADEICNLAGSVRPIFFQKKLKWDFLLLLQPQILILLLLFLLFFLLIIITHIYSLLRFLRRQAPALGKAASSRSRQGGNTGVRDLLGSTF